MDVWAVKGATLLFKALSTSRWKICKTKFSLHRYTINPVLCTFFCLSVCLSVCLSLSPPLSLIHPLSLSLSLWVDFWVQKTYFNLYFFRFVDYVYTGRWPPRVNASCRAAGWLEVVERVKCFCNVASEGIKPDKTTATTSTTTTTTTTTTCNVAWPADEVAFSRTGQHGD